MWSFGVLLAALWTGTHLFQFHASQTDAFEEENRMLLQPDRQSSQTDLENEWTVTWAVLETRLSCVSVSVHWAMQPKHRQPSSRALSLSPIRHGHFRC